MARPAILIAACMGLIWISRSLGAALLEVNDSKPSVGLRAVPPSVPAAHGARAKLPAQGAGRTQPLRAENMTVIATNEPVEYPGLYASLLRADAADMSVAVTFGESTWQGATSSAIHLQAPVRNSADFVRPPALKVVRPTHLIASSEETFDDPTCFWYPTCEDTTCYMTCFGLETCDGISTCDGTGTCDGTATCQITCATGGMTFCDDGGNTCTQSQCGGTYFAAVTCDGGFTCYQNTYGCDGPTCIETCDEDEDEEQRAPQASRQQIFLTKVLANMF